MTDCRRTATPHEDVLSTLRETRRAIRTHCCAAPGVGRAVVARHFFQVRRVVTDSTSSLNETVTTHNARHSPTQVLSMFLGECAQTS
jgi:hypothetical protein